MYINSAPREKRRASVYIYIYAARGDKKRRGESQISQVRDEEFLKGCYARGDGAGR